MKQGLLFSFILICLALPSQTRAQTGIQILPQPQVISLKNEKVSLKELYSLKGDMEPSQANMKILRELFNISDQAAGKNLVINRSFFSEKKQQVSGSYQVQITSQNITIDAFDERGLFYALQTLRQLQKNPGGERTIPAGLIVDYPDVPIRGTVEGFYGEPWTHADRVNQLKFYGEFKMNTYIYGPKDDPYHSSPNWRKPYPAAEEERIKHLVEEAQRNYVDFVWAIHPGQDIKWNREDSLNIIVKFEWMYQLGVRNFAVFFDDISGVGTDAKRQAQLMNYILEAFVKPKKDIGSLIICPTEYNKAWSNKKEGTYLDILGEQLDPSIYVMWTGNSVISDNTVEGLQWVNRRIKRKALVWWNFPVSDYVRDHLLMGPAYGLELDAAPYMSGFVSNPMDKSEASKVALVGVSWYTWNTKSYDYQKAWQAANELIMPEAPELFALFNRHNSDLGPNGHGYRRDESVEIKPVIDSFTTALNAGNFRPMQSKRLRSLFDSIALAGRKIPEMSKNKRLIEQMQPWLLQFEMLGKAGIAGMQMAENKNQKNKKGVWTQYLILEKALDSMAVIDRTLNQNPYQPGVKSGSLVLAPFVHFLQQAGNQWILEGSNLTEVAVPSKTSSALKTNIQKLEQQPLLLTNESVAVSPVLEVIPVEPAGYVGVEIAPNLIAEELQYQMQGGKISEWAAMEVSVDGNNWEKLEKLQGNGKGSMKIANRNIRFIRFINISLEKQSFFLKKFQVLVEPMAGVQGNFEIDGSLETFETVKPNAPLQIELPERLSKKGLQFLVDKPASDKVVVKGYKKGFGRGKIMVESKDKYFIIPAKKMSRIRNISIHVNGQPVRVHEILPL